MSVLYSLAPEGRRLLTDQLLRGLPPLEEEVEHLLSPVSPTVPLGLFDDAVDRVMDMFPARSADADAALAPMVHGALPLSRRVAADPGIWRYLAVVYRTEYVSWRWEWRARMQMKRRFWRYGTRPDSNAFCRLWWIAELTCEHSVLEGSETDPERGYALTRRILESSTLTDAIFKRTLAHYRPAVRAVASVLAEQSPADIERVIKALGRRLSVVPVESQTEDDLTEMIRSLL